jgi:glucose/arabinose dehydrogenase
MDETELLALKVTDLQAQLKELGLNVKGKKAELVARILEARAVKGATGSSAATGAASEAAAAAESAAEAKGEQKPAEGELKRPREEESDAAAVTTVTPVVADAPVAHHVAAAVAPSGAVVLVTGFVRPFTENQAKEFVSGGAALSTWFVALDS